MNSAMKLTQDDLIRYIAETFWLEAEELDGDTRLFSEGLLDSFSLVDLVSYIESECGVKIKAADVTLDNLDSVNRILTFVARL